MTQTVILHGKSQREFAKRLIDLAPVDAVVKFSEAKRTLDQNSKLWAMLSDVSRAKPNGRCQTPEVWKALFMHACGHSVQFEMGLNGQPFPVGFSSSKLTKRQMADLIETIYQYGAENGVVWTEPDSEARAAA
ncbi:recombination protein NinB [Agrobacterium tumefaciens]|nr:recombination protein NinB [Agrobacterium tumefaciens]